MKYELKLGIELELEHSIELKLKVKPWDDPTQEIELELRSKIVHYITAKPELNSELIVENGAETGATAGTDTGIAAVYLELEDKRN